MEKPARMIFDGDCGFCRIWIEYAKRLTGDRVEYAPYQQVAGDFPEIPPERFPKAVHLALPDGKVVAGAEAVFETLALAGRRSWIALYRHSPGFAALCERVYSFIADHRPLFYKLTRLLFGPVVEPASHARVQWLFLKALGVIYAMAFLSIAVQITGLIGSKGVLPIGIYLQRVAEAFPSPGRYWTFPTVFWLNSSDLALKLIPVVGVLFSILLIVGVFQRAALIVCYVLYLSLTTAGQEFLSFQWDILLLETGFLAIFLSHARLIIWMFRWLLFRLMLLSGAVKLLSHDVTWRSLTALRFHYYTQPLPTPLAYYMNRLPDGFQTFSVGVVFAIELGAPWLLLGPRRLRFVGGCLVVLLQVAILLTGNYAYFNWLTIALCIPLLDDQALVGRAFRPAAGLLPGVLLRRSSPVVAAIILLITTGQLLGQFFQFKPDLTRTLERSLSPLYLANTYGLFAVMTTTRPEIILEGSTDGQTWREYEFRYKPGDLRQPPHWVAPHQPRLDWQMWFAALGNYRTNPWFVNLVYRLLQGSPEVTALLARDPFPAAPPRYIRALIYDYTFDGPGAWWKRQPKGTYTPAVSLEDFAQP